MNKDTLKTVGTFAILALLAYMGNVLALPLCYSIDFLFGSVFSLIALRLLGMRRGLTVALIAAGYTYFAWNHPFAVVTFMAEALWIGIALRRGRRNLLLLDALYWLLLGMPLVLLLYGGVMQLELPSTLIIALKQGVNGVTNALLATIILDHTPLLRWLRGKETAPQPFAATLFNLVAAAMMLPALVLILMTNQRENQRIQEVASQDLVAETLENQTILKAWMTRQINAVGFIANLGSSASKPELQVELNHVRTLLPDFSTLFIGNAAGTAIAFSPPVNELNKSTIGVNFADRPWFKESTDTLRPVISGVFQGRVGAFKPIFSICVPVVKSGRLSGFGLGSIDLERLRLLFNPSHLHRKMFLTIIDQNSRVVISTDQSRKPLDSFNDGDATHSRLNREVFLRIPARKKFTGNIHRWEGACYYLRQTAPDTPWTLLLEYPIQPLQKYAYETTTHNLELLALFFAVTLGGAALVSRSLTRPLAALAAVSLDIPQRIDRGQEIPWPIPLTLELTGLTANFRLTAKALQERIEQARLANFRLEEEVRLRTAELALSENRFRTLFHEHSAVFLLINPISGIIVDANAGAARFYGLSIGELRATNINSINLLPAAEVSDLTNRAKNHQQNSFLFPHKLHDGSQRLVEVHSSSILVNGEPLLFSIIHDVTDRESAVERVRESEERLRAIFDLAAVGIARVKPSGEFIEVNDHLCILFGYSRDELLTMTFQELTLPDDLAAGISSATKLLTGEIASYAMEKRYLRKSGEIFWGLMTSALARPAPPATGYTVVVVEEITGRKILEQQLSQISREQRVILDSSGVGIAMIKRRRMGWVNAAMTRIFGYSQEEMTGMATKELYQDLAEYDRVGAATHPSIMRGEEYQTDTRFRHHDGGSIWIHLTGRLVSADDITLGSVWIFEDITVRVALEQARREDEARFRSSQAQLSTIFRTSPDVIAISERLSGRFREVNEAFERLFGYSREETLGRTAHDLDIWESPELRVRMLDQLDNQPRLENHETRFRRRNGEVFPALLSLEETELEGVPCLIFSARDITEQGTIKEELLQSRNAAQAANRAKSQFLANMSHEIRTPLNGVLGMAQLLALTELTAEQQSYLAALKASGKNLLALISDILDLSKIEAGKMDLEITDFDLRIEIREMINLLNLRARDKGLELDALVDPGTPHLLRGDAGRLRQILNNLVGNAIKFTAKGSISLTLSKEREDGSEATLRFMIADTGIGIPAEKLESIFDPFTQADGSTTRSYGGTGLGLTISRQLAALMGGSMGVESVPGNGSTFWFTATLEKQTPVPRSPHPPPEGNRIPSGGGGTSEADSLSGGGARLLLVEDEPTNRLVIATLLTKSGFLVDLADNGRQALTSLENNDYALVLMDCMMPVLNGYEATAAIRDQASAVRNHLIPVIALTAKAFKDDRALCLAAGMNDYLTKPIDLDDLLKMIRKWTSLRLRSETTLRDHPSTSLRDHAQGPPIRETTVEVEAKTYVYPLEIFNRDEFLQRNLGDLELSREVAIIFRESAPNYGESLRGALAANDTPGLRQAAHKLKGAAANLSLSSLSEIAGRMEAGSDDPEKTAQLLPELEQKLDQAVAALQLLLVSPEGGTAP